MSDDVHPVREIKPVRAESLHTRIQMKLIASAIAGQFSEPAEKLFAITPRSGLFRREEIVHVQDFSPRETFRDAKTGHGPDRTAVLEKYQFVSALLLSLHARDEILFLNMRPELNHHGVTAENIRLGSRMGDGGHEERSAARSAQSIKRFTNPS
jgi:hypothetical protein